MKKSILATVIFSLVSFSAASAVTDESFIRDGNSGKVSIKDGTKESYVSLNSSGRLSITSTDTSAGTSDSVAVNLATDADIDTLEKQVLGDTDHMTIEEKSAYFADLGANGSVYNMTKNVSNVANSALNVGVQNSQQLTATVNTLGTLQNDLQTLANNSVNDTKLTQEINDAKAYTDAKIAAMGSGVSLSTVNSKVSTGVSEAKKYAKNEADRAENNAIAYAAAGDAALSKKIDSTKTELNNKIDAGQAADAKARDTIVANQAKTDAAQNKANKAAREAIVEAQAIVDRKQDVEFSAFKTEQAKVDSMQYAKFDELYTMQGETNLKIAGLDSRLTAVEGLAQQNANDIRTLKGMVAANAASNAIEWGNVPANSIGFGFGVAHYADFTGASLGAMYVGETTIIKATVAGTDADKWNDVVYGVGATKFFQL